MAISHVCSFAAVFECTPRCHGKSRLSCSPSSRLQYLKHFDVVLKSGRVAAACSQGKQPHMSFHFVVKAYRGIGGDSMLVPSAHYHCSYRVLLIFATASLDQNDRRLISKVSCTRCSPAHLHVAANSAFFCLAVSSTDVQRPLLNVQDANSAVAVARPLSQVLRPLLPPVSLDHSSDYVSTRVLC